MKKISSVVYTFLSGVPEPNHQAGDTSLYTY